MKVIIHLGHHKTGSTYLQHCFVGKNEELAKNGVIYPKPHNRYLHNVDSWQSILKTVKKYKNKEFYRDKTLLFSCEVLYEFLAYKTKSLNDLSNLGVNVELIVFSRCPMEYLQSIYGQIVKSPGFSGSIEDFLQENNNKIDVVENMAKIVDAADSLHMPVHIYNYSKRKKDLLSLVENHLDVPEGTLRPEQDNMVINRSLTPDEVLFARSFNKFLGKKAPKFVSAPLVTNLPNIRAQKIKPEKQVIEEFIMSMNRDIDNFNKKYGHRFDAYDRLNANDVEGVESPECATLSPQQLEVVASAVANHLQMQKFPHSVKQFKLKKLKPKFLRAKWKPLMRVYGRDM